MYKILNAKIVDGTNSEPYLGSILIEQNKIIKVAKGKLDDYAQDIIDAKGRYVTPGFIDIHRHGDIAMFKENFGLKEIAQGITTIINGNCGLSAAPAPLQYKDDINAYLKPILGSIPNDLDCHDYESLFKQIEARDLPINVGYNVGNGTIRMSVSGFNNNHFSREQIAQAKLALKNALASGCLGVTLGLAYIPECNYDFAKLYEVLSPMKDYDAILSTHIRGEGNILVNSIQEVVDLAIKLNVPLNISHFKAVGSQNWQVSLAKAIDIIEQGQKHIPISVDVYPYIAGSSLLAQILPPWVLEGGTNKAIARLKDKIIRDKITNELKQWQSDYENILKSIGFEALLITSLQSEKNQKYLGKTIQEICDKQHLDPYEFTYDLLIEEELNVSMVDFIMSEDDVLKVMQLPYSSIISDSLYTDGGKPHPRVYGAFSHFLSNYIYDKKIMPIQTAIYKLTSHPANIYHLNNKGLIKEGYDADLLIFDLSRIKTASTYADPVHLSEGIDYCFIGGKIAYQNNQLINQKLGKLIRR